MPGMDGLTLLSEVQSRLPMLPVIVMTAHADLDSAVKSYQGGAFEYLPKPFDLDEAVGLVRRALMRTQKRQTHPSRGWTTALSLAKPRHARGVSHHRRAFGNPT